MIHELAQKCTADSKYVDLDEWMACGCAGASSGNIDKRGAEL